MKVCQSKDFTTELCCIIITLISCFIAFIAQISYCIHCSIGILYINTNCQYLFAYIVPIPNVNMSVTEAQIPVVGQSLTLECSVTTVRGITSRVDIVWSRDGLQVQMIVGANITLLSEKFAVYEALYTIPLLSTTEDGRVYQCEVVINTSPPVMANDNMMLDVIGNLKCIYITCTFT